MKRPLLCLKIGEGAKQVFYNGSFHANENITTPVLLCQAGKDRLVRLEGQDAFDRACDKVTLIRFPESRHEIYNATDEIREPYFKAVISYFDAYAGKK